MDAMEKIKAIQMKLQISQESTEEVTVSSGGELKVVMNGSIQITDLVWLKSVESGDDQLKILKETVNQAIINISKKIKQQIQALASS